MPSSEPRESAEARFLPPPPPTLFGAELMAFGFLLLLLLSRRRQRVRMLLPGAGLDDEPCDDEAGAASLAPPRPRRATVAAAAAAADTAAPETFIVSPDCSGGDWCAIFGEWPSGKPAFNTMPSSARFVSAETCAISSDSVASADIWSVDWPEGVRKRSVSVAINRVSGRASWPREF